MSGSSKLVLLGVGQTARAVVNHFSGQSALEIWGTTRGTSGAALAELGIKPILLDQQRQWQETLARVCRDAYVLVSFPPGDNSDQVFSEIVFASEPQAVVYISSTGVYGKTEGVIDENSAVDESDSRALVRLNAERIWAAKSTVLRAPGLYNAKSGLHQRLLSGTYRLPGDGLNHVSRIHLDDFAAIIAKVFVTQSQLARQTYVVGDLKPASHLEVVTWLCKQLSLPLPAAAPLSEVNPSLRGNRQIRAAQILADLDFELKYPTYVEGFTQCLASL
ncbi:MAG: hypothetical protein Q8T09_18790 [Candidatus Melainabacteria bacterium]|nr:hypothetical protein [Candidatus Melainabacteria bacterium]